VIGAVPSVKHETLFPTPAIVAAVSTALAEINSTQFDPRARRCVFSTMEELGISLVAYSPLTRGFLGGTLTEYADMNTNDGRGAWPRFTGEALRANTRIVDVLNEFGKTRGMTSSQIALAWMMSKHPFVVPVFGTTKLSHLEEDLRASDYTLTADEITELETKVSAFPVVGERYDALQQSRVEY
jgi:aryl-alcohol dehydrogenase-like predicted oxidoreductase